MAGFEPWTSEFSDLDKQNDHLTQKAKSSCALEEEKCVGMVLNWDGSAAEYLFKIWKPCKDWFWRSGKNHRFWMDLQNKIYPHFGYLEINSAALPIVIFTNPT